MVGVPEKAEVPCNTRYTSGDPLGVNVIPVPVEVVDGNDMPLGVPGARQLTAPLPVAMSVNTQPVGLVTVIVDVSVATTVGLYCIYNTCPVIVPVFEKLTLVFEYVVPFSET